MFAIVKIFTFYEYFVGFKETTIQWRVGASSVRQVLFILLTHRVSLYEAYILCIITIYFHIKTQ